jgi:hypothetical protein
MNVELESVWKETEIAKVDVPFLRLPGRAEKTHESPKSKYFVPRPKFEPNISRKCQIRRLLGPFIRLYSTLRFK